MSGPTDNNPFAAPALESSETVVATDVEVIRKQYLSHEVSIKSIGLLYWLVGMLWGLVAILYFIAAVVATFGSASYEPAFLNLLFGVLLGGITGLLIAVGRGIRKLRPWSRTVATFLSIIGLLLIPIGTLINLYFLYLLQSKKGSFVFSLQYQEVIAATPHLKYRTSATAWTVLAVFVALLVLAVLSLLVGTIR